MLEAVVAVLIGGLVVATLSGSGPADSAAFTREQRAAPTYEKKTSAVPRRIAIGITAQGVPADLTVLKQYIAIAGRPPAIVMYFRGFNAPLFYPSEEVNLRLTGVTPMVTWNPVLGKLGIPLSQIAAGRYDGYLGQQALSARRWRRLIYIRFGQEMNLRDSQWATGVDGNTPAMYIAAWRHIVSVFRARGATNVRWVWSPNIDCNGHCPFSGYFPGDAWVSDVALDGYNFSTAHSVAWLSFQALFRSSYAEITRLSTRPVMIGETASSEVGGSKAAWIRHAFLDVIPKLFPRVAAVIWWDRVDQADWRVNSSPASLQAWRSVVASPLYGG
jgi:hypothetical protein